MPKLVDRTGLRYGQLVVIGRAPNKDRCTRWLCQCDCGNQVIVKSGELHAGDTKSCGCLRKETTAELTISHGMTNTPEYTTWTDIRQRCNNPNCQAYYLYGSRGITIDPRWDDFAIFYADMGPRPSPKHTIERIDNNGSYSLENCKWATRTEQANNTRRNHLLTFRGKTMTTAQWAREIGIHVSVLYDRINKCGWSVERTLTTPIGKHHPLPQETH